VPGLIRILSRHDWVVNEAGRPWDRAVQRRIEAITALGAIETEDAEEGILSGLNDGDPSVRHAAVGALRSSLTARGARALARAAATWRGPALARPRAAAIDTLVENGDELHAVEYTQVLVEDRGRSELDDEEQSAVRRLFLADSGPVAEIFANQLALRLGEDPDGRVVPQALVAMGAVSIDPLISALDDPNRRLLAAATLGAARDLRAVTPLVRVLSSNDSAACAAAARALGDIRDPAALEPLIRASGDPDADVRDAAFDALDSMRSVLLALLAAVAIDASHDPVAPVDGVARPAAPRFPAAAVDVRAVLNRLIRRER
jgi:HEAT repeat protein